MFNLLYIITLIGTLLSPAGLNQASGNPSALHLENSKPNFVSTPIQESVQPVLKTVINDSSNFDNRDYQTLITKLGINLHPASSFSTAGGNGTESELDHCAELTYLTLEKVPYDISSKVKDLTLHFDNSARRGLGGGGTIILRCSNETDQELVGVLMHELGHVADSSLLIGHFWSGNSEFVDGKNPVYNDDLSLDFYRISFSNEKTIKAQSTKEDFVSGYAMSDPFEDFAETFNFYVLHGQEFRAMKTTDSALNQKYNFMKDKVFAGQEFGFDTVNSAQDFAARDYDSTLISFNLKNFIAF